MPFVFFFLFWGWSFLLTNINLFSFSYDCFLNCSFIYFLFLPKLGRRGSSLFFSFSSVRRERVFSHIMWICYEDSNSRLLVYKSKPVFHYLDPILLFYWWLHYCLFVICLFRSSIAFLHPRTCHSSMEDALPNGESNLISFGRMYRYEWRIKDN